MAATPSAMLPLGTIAPDFTLPDTVSGEEIALSDGELIAGVFTQPHLHFAVRISPYNRFDGWGGFANPLLFLDPSDLIILDVLMPRQSGIRLYRELKTDKSLKNVKVIILSGIARKTFLRSQKALTEFGGKEVPEPEIYLEKPVEPDELAETIKKYLG